MYDVKIYTCNYKQSSKQIKMLVIECRIMNQIYENILKTINKI